MAAGQHADALSYPLMREMVSVCRAAEFFRSAILMLLTFVPLVSLQAQVLYATPYAFTTLAGVAGNAGSTDGTGNAARFSSPYGMAVDGSGNVYVADSGNHVIRKITPAGVVTTLAGSAGNSGSSDGTGSAARFNFPFGVAVDGSGNVYVADYFNYTIRKITAAGVVTTLAGSAGNSGSTDGTGSAAKFNVPTDVTVDVSGNVYVADYGNHTIRKITSVGAVTTLAGSAGISGSVDGAGSAARFKSPDGVTVDGLGNVYVADYGNHTVRKISAAGMVTTLAGLAGSNNTIDGIGNASRFNYPTGVAVDGAGVLFVVDYFGQSIRRITSSGVVTTIGGSVGVVGSTDGTGNVALFKFPVRVAVDRSGNVYIADNVNNTIRKGIPLPVVPSITTVVGSSVTFTTTATGTPTPVYQWQKNGVNIAGASASTYTINNAALGDAGNYTVAFSNEAGSSTSDIGTLRVIEVTVHGNAMVYGTTTFPTTAPAGSVVNFAYNVTNFGTKTWGANHYLALMDSEANLADFGEMDGTAAGANKTVQFNFAAPAVPGTYQYTMRPLENNVEWFGDQITLTLTVTAPVVSAQGNAVAYGATSFPLTVTAGSVVNFNYNVTNLGTKAWGANHKLALLDSSFSLLQSGDLDGTAMGASKTLNFSFPAPAVAGTYQYIVRPLENGVEWFGDQLTITLKVTPPVVSSQGNAVAYGATTFPSFPATVTAGSLVSFTYNVMNLGTKAWGANHYLALLDSGFTLIQFGDLNGTAIGASKLVGLSFTAPTTPGTYQYIVRPLENGVEWFGNQLTLTLIVTAPVVTAQGNAAVYGATTFPATAAAGSTVNFTYNVTNMGTKAWGANHYLALLDSGFGLIQLGGLNSTAIGASKTVSLSFTAPSVAGTYHYILRPLENGVEWFDTQTQLTLTLTVF